MKTLQIDEAKARSLYPTSTPEFKSILEDSFGKEFFSQKITDRVKTVEDAFIIVGENYAVFLAKCQAAGDELDEISYKERKRVIKALNEGWKPDWSNSNEYKYFPIFIKNKSGVGFVFDRSYYYSTGCCVGSRHVLKNRTLSDYMGQQFPHLYQNEFVY